MTQPVELQTADAALAACIPAGTRLVAPAVQPPPGVLDPAALAGDAFALLLVEGVVQSDVSFGGRTVTETLVPGDLLLPARPRSDGLDSHRVVSADDWCTLARLDAHFLLAAARFPALMRELYRRLSDQEHRIAVNGAIGQLPRTDDRIVASLRQLAYRLGVEEEEGTVLHLPMTHATIGRMVGASRPTVSLALTRLAEDGCLRRRPDGAWLLAHSAQ